MFGLKEQIKKHKSGQMKKSSNRFGVGGASVVSSAIFK